MTRGDADPFKKPSKWGSGRRYPDSDPDHCFSEHSITDCSTHLLTSPQKKYRYWKNHVKKGNDDPFKKPCKSGSGRPDLDPDR
jgi:hypothetical protein